MYQDIVILAVFILIYSSVAASGIAYKLKGIKQE
jgi:hypothetical protein